MTTTQNTQQVLDKAHAHTILERSVCLTLACRYLGNDRKVDLKDLVAAATDGDSATPLHVSEHAFGARKKLIDPKELRPVLRVQGQAKHVLRAEAISAHRIFGERTYLVPIGRLAAVDAQLTELAAKVHLEAELLAQRYAEAKERQRALLGRLFKDGDYLTEQQVRDGFGLTWDYVSFGAPDRLETVDRVLYERTRDRYEQRMSAAYDEVVAELRGSALQVVTDLARRLQDGPDGKPQTIRGMVLRDLQAYVDRLPQRNITGDTELTDALYKVGRLAAGLQVADLRDSANLRRQVREAAEVAKLALEGLVAAAPTRAVAFGDID